MPQTPTPRPCVTCGRVRRIALRGECDACRTYRRRKGVTRPYGAQDGRPLASGSSTPTGPLHPGWKADDAITWSAAHRRARTVLPALGTCELCGNRPAHDRHHWNRDDTDNRAENLVAACRSCHRMLHLYAYGPSGRAAMRRAVSAAYSRANRLLPVLGACEHCGRPAEARHHWDRNPQNNARENLAGLCLGCHGTLHAHAYD